METNKTMQEGDDSRIWEKYYHIDAQVKAQDVTLSMLTAGVSRIEHHLLNKPAVNFLGWIAAALVVLGMFSATMWGLVEYVELRLRPIEVTAGIDQAAILALEEYRFTDNFKGGLITQYFIKNDQELARHEAEVHALRSRLDSLEKQRGS